MSTDPPLTATMNPQANTENPLIASSTLNTQDSIEYLKRKIERDGEKQVAELMQTANSNTNFQSSLLNIMKSGGDEFYKQTGRHMTYSEMREMYG